ncbi:hypothetical protein SLS60_004807 [Paraconiothyrium brasiliense]|uniref:Uncharacterized protein n=1 Tax=Paraconiothyrium brasiliense TaxID=300254 RepID=A0ABR3RM43_9PLEO
MCTVIHYWFQCGHYVARCKSRCGGTRFKSTRNSLRAACTAEGYITIKRATPCSKCSREAWNLRWQTRIEKARAFEHGLVKDRLPGAAEVSNLIKELDRAYELESWELKNTIPYGDKSRIRRVNPAKVEWSKLPSSPLTREVQPEDIIFPVVTEPVYDEEQEDDNWMQVTDPLHPISTNYEVFCAGIDDDYLDLLTQEDPHDFGYLEQDDHDPISPNWDWQDEFSGSVDSSESHNSSSNRPIGGTEQLMAWSPAAEVNLSSQEIGSEVVRSQEAVEQDQIQSVIETFRNVVNITNGDARPLSTTALAGDVNADDGTSKVANTANIEYEWVGGPSDAPSPHRLTPYTEEQSNQAQSSPKACIRANSTNAKYDAFRKSIVHPRGSTRYYEQWLVECRLEIREMVGPEGLFIPDPARPRLS